jgi:hypothetical protein
MNLKAFPRSRPHTETKDSHARYFAENDWDGAIRVTHRDGEGRRYRVGPVRENGTRRLFVKLPKGGAWYGNDQRQVDLVPIKGGGDAPRSVVIVFLGVKNSFLQKRGYVDVMGWG